MPMIVIDGRVVRSDNIRDVVVGEDLAILLYTARQVEIAKAAMQRHGPSPFARIPLRKTTRD